MRQGEGGSEFAHTLLTPNDLWGSDRGSEQSTLGWNGLLTTASDEFRRAKRIRFPRPNLSQNLSIPHTGFSLRVISS